MWDKLRNFLTPLYGDIDETCRADSQIFMDTLNNVSVTKDFVKKLPINLQAKYNVFFMFLHFYASVRALFISLKMQPVIKYWFTLTCQCFTSQMLP